MPFCGFNKKMIGGLIMFLEGIYEATVKRGKEAEVTDSEAFENELLDMSIFKTQIDEELLKNVEIQNRFALAVVSIAEFSKTLFEQIAHEAAEGSEYDNSFKKTVKRLSVILEGLENKHQELKILYPREKAIKDTVSWLKDQLKSG